MLTLSEILSKSKHVIAPHKPAHGGVLEEPAVALPQIVKLRALKDDMALVREP